jgi:hypothetical protein
MNFKWTEEVKDTLKQEVLKGTPIHETVILFTQKYGRAFTYDDIRTARQRFGLTMNFLVRDNDIRLYTDCLELPDGRYMICADFHSPYHSEGWVNRMVHVSEALQLKNLIIAGDLFDMDFAKHWYSDDETKLDYETEKVKPVIELLNWYDKITLIRGNHEHRVNRMTEGKIQAKHLFDIFGLATWENKFTYSVYDKLFIGDSWMIVHPKSYSQISGSVGIRLAEKFHANVINAHGHFCAMRFDRSGEYVSIDIGGLFDTNKVEYINKKTTTHPMWNNGFVVVDGDSFHLFHQKTDWGYYGL